ncbi:MAG: tetratricopeptide repeat protein [Promethearchaeota archaeon]|jgi:tetratricopeptide (TPR) repeat protein
MTVSIPQELEQARKLLDEDRYQETLDLLTEFDKRKEVSKDDLIESLLIKGWLHFHEGRGSEAANIAEQAYQLSKDQENSLQTFDILYLKGRIEIFLGEDELPLILNQMKKTYLILQNISPIQQTKREASLNLIEGLVSYYIEGDYEKAFEYYNNYISLLEHLNNGVEIAEALSTISNFCFASIDLNNSLKFAKQSLSFKEIRKRDKCRSFYFLFYISAAKGELDTASEYINQFQDITDKINNKSLIAWGFINRGYLSRLKGDLDQALNYYKEGLMISDDFGLDMLKWIPYLSIIRIYIEKDSYEEAKRYLKIFKEFAVQTNIKQSRRMLLFSEGLVLKASPDIRDRFKSEALFKEFIETRNPSRNFTISALTHLCDLLLMELRRTNDLNLLNEINPLITRFSKSAEEQESFWRLAEAKILQAKLALIQMNMGEARKLLTEAQVIADEHGLGILAQKVSSEHDTLLNQLSKWKELKEENAPVSKRIELSSLDEVVERLLEKRKVEQLKIEDEDPILLLILAEGGVLLFSYPFTVKWKRDDELFGSFLSAINSFSNEFFTEGVDRFKFGQHTVLMEDVEKFSIYYLFKGQTYLAKQKLRHFKEKIHESTPIWQAFEKYFQSSQVMELKDFPFLEAFVTDIFVDKTLKIINT